MILHCCHTLPSVFLTLVTRDILVLLDTVPPVGTLLRYCGFRLGGERGGGRGRGGRGREGRRGEGEREGGGREDYIIYYTSY